MRQTSATGGNPGKSLDHPPLPQRGCVRHQPNSDERNSLYSIMLVLAKLDFGGLIVTGLPLRQSSHLSLHWATADEPMR